MRTLGLTAAIGILLIAAPAKAQDGDGARRRRTTTRSASTARGSPARRATPATVRVEAYPPAAQRVEAYPAATQRVEAYPSATQREEAYPPAARRTNAYPPATQREEAYPVAQEEQEEPAPRAYAAAAPARELAPPRVRSRYEPRLDAEPEDERPRHDGLYLRLEGGLGYMYVALPTGEDGRYAGPASAGAIHAGATIQDKALLGIQVWGAALANPSYTSAAGTRKSGLNVYHLGVGPELTLYLAPSNFHASAAVGATWLTVQSVTGAARSKPGLGGRFVAGHEWWLGRRWGFGLAGTLSFASNQLELDTGGWEPFTTWCVGLVTSLTYN